jgi:NAD(P)-dependent dehydrogenase (short-subunit alcohol dehydrogenase family)
VTDAEAVEDLVARTVQDHGTIDRVVHAAVRATTGRIVDVGAEEFHRINAVVYGGTVNVVAATLPRLVAQERGDLVLFASLAGLVPSPRFAAYTASKFAVVALAETIAFEHRDSGVRICCVCPPVVQTPLLEDFDLPGVVNAAGGSLESAIDPEVVLDSIEVSLERGRLFAFPGPMTRAVWWGRRLAPRMMWAGWRRAGE